MSSEETKRNIWKNKNENHLYNDNDHITRIYTTVDMKKK